MKEKEIDFEAAQDKLNDECGGSGSSNHNETVESNNKLLWLAAAAIIFVATILTILFL